MASIRLQCAGIAQLVERNLAKVEVAGSNPVSRSKPVETPVLPGFSFCGKEKSLAEWQSGYAAACKAVDAGSIPTSASNFQPCRGPIVEYAMLLLSSPSADAAALATQLV